MRCLPGPRLICDEKDRFLRNVAVADDHLHNNGIIEASGEWTEYELLAVGEVGGLDHT
jgi:hypothetical protein